jgi:hypothetical protein
MKENDYVNKTGSSWEPVALVAALVLGFLFWGVFALEQLGLYGPGLGVLVFVAVYFTAVMAVLGKKARWNRRSLVLLGAALVLSVCCTLYALWGFTVINCFLILLLAAAATFQLSGQSCQGLGCAAILPETVKLSVWALVGGLNKPWEALKSLGFKNSSTTRRVVLAVVVSLPVVGVVMALLLSADAVFASFFQGLIQALEALSLGRVIWHLVRGLGLSLFVASGLFFLRETPPEPAENHEKKAQKNALPLLVSALLLDGVYCLFCSVQLRYLFGGHEAASMAGGWASYAREGFFQLVAVAAINLGLCLAGFQRPAYSSRAQRWLQLADSLMLVFTAVILLSALRRMELYIAVFGLSVLRLMTLWGMAVLAVGLLAAGWKLWHPRFSFFAVVAPVALGSWCVLCLCNPGGIIARHNVNAYLAGDLTTVDVDYLENLTTDALPALYTLEEADPQNPSITALVRRVEASTEDIPWTAWKASFLFRQE